MPQSHKARSDLSSLLVTSILLAAQVASAADYSIEFEYDDGDPWNGLPKDDAAFEAQIFAETHTLHPSMRHMHETGMGFGAAQPEGENVDSSRIPTSMYHRAGEARAQTPIAALSRQERRKLHRLSLSTKYDFPQSVAWCLHAKLPEACEDAANLINDNSPGQMHPRMNPHGRPVSKIDGSDRKAREMRMRFFDHAKKLRAKEQAHQTKSKPGRQANRQGHARPHR
jgi:hypothetical protein